MAFVTGHAGHGPDILTCPGKPDEGRMSRTPRTSPDGFPPKGEPSSVRGVLAAVQQIEVLARRVERLTVSHRDPERFHEDKSEIAADLKQLARKVQHGRLAL